MWIKIISWAFKTVAGRYVTAGLVTVLLGSSVAMWQSHKNDLRDEGRQECVQEINRQTVIDLQNALVAEKIARAQASAWAIAAAEENAVAVARLKASESKVDSLLQARKEQEKNDESYAAWSNTPLPDGVASRLRGLTGRDPDSRNEDSN